MKQTLIMEKVLKFSKKTNSEGSVKVEGTVITKQIDSNDNLLKLEPKLRTESKKLLEVLEQNKNLSQEQLVKKMKKLVLIPIISLLRMSVSSLNIFNCLV